MCVQMTSVRSLLDAEGGCGRVRVFRLTGGRFAWPGGQGRSSIDCDRHSCDRPAARRTWQQCPGSNAFSVIQSVNAIFPEVAAAGSAARWSSRYLEGENCLSRPEAVDVWRRF